MSNAEQMKKDRRFLPAVIAAAVTVTVLYLIWHWGFCRAFVGPDEALLVINKFGDPLPPDRIVVPDGEDHYKGVQADLRGPGRYFINPVSHSWKVIPLIEIPAGEPQRWEFDADGNLKKKDYAPQIGLVSL